MIPTCTSIVKAHLKGCFREVCSKYICERLLYWLLESWNVVWFFQDSHSWRQDSHHNMNDITCEKGRMPYIILLHNMIQETLVPLLTSTSHQKNQLSPFRLKVDYHMKVSLKNTCTAKYFARFVSVRTNFKIFKLG